MTTKEMQDVMYKFEQKYPNHRGLDIRTRKMILDGLLIIVPLHNKKFMVVESSKENQKKAKAYNKKMKSVVDKRNRDFQISHFTATGIDFDLLKRLAKKA